MNDNKMRKATSDLARPNDNKSLDDFVQSSGLYIFPFRFCPIYCGYEKANGVQSIGYRRKILVRANQSDAIRIVLDYWVNSGVKQNDQKLTDSTWTLSELWTEKLRLQLLVPRGKGSFACKQARGNQSANRVQGKNHYPFPDHLVTQTVGVTVISNPLKVLCDGELNGNQLRGYKAKQEDITLDLYWLTRICKPGALPCSLTSIAAGNKLAFEQYRHGLLQQECKARVGNRKKSRIPQTNFPQPQGLRYLSQKHLPLEAQEPLPLREHLEFISSGRHLILTGTMDTRKIHPASDQGTQVDSEGSFVLLIMLLRMLTMIRVNRSEQRDL